MDKVNKIINHPYYRECVRKIEELEADRKFCRHGMAHFLDVARIAFVLDLEENAAVPKEWIYAAALLHDIGRHEQYLHGIPHHQAGAYIAEKIMADCGFGDAEKTAILEAILEHRSKETKNTVFSDLICRADKLSRACYCCPAESECNWSAEKKNLFLKI